MGRDTLLGPDMLRVAWCNILTFPPKIAEVEARDAEIYMLTGMWVGFAQRIENGMTED
jgi:hypothetical protein